LLAGVVGVHAFQGTRWTIAGEVPGLSGSHHPAIAPYGLFTTATSLVQVAVGSENLWQKFAPAIGLDPGDERFATNRARVAHRDDLVAAIEAIFAAEPAEHWLDLLLGAGIPAGKVRALDEVYAWEQTRSQGLLLEVDHPAYGPLTLPGSAIRFEDNPWSGGRVSHLPPPLLDEHGDAIRAWAAED
jgi:crotonobetainyl-CoA:carnitine CoA-transferase CaiB-like acyl-CoA transferase